MIQVLAVDQEHRDLGAILARDKDLARDVGAEVELDGWREERFAPLAIEVVAEDRDRVGEGMEEVEHLLVLPPASQGRDVSQAHRAESGESDLAQWRAVQREALEKLVGVVHVGDDELIVHQLDGLEHIGAFRNQCFPVGLIRAGSRRWR